MFQAAGDCLGEYGMPNSEDTTPAPQTSHPTRHPTGGCPEGSPDIVRRLCRNLDIAERAITELAPLGYRDESKPEFGVSPEKVIAETSVFLLACSTIRREHPEIEERVNRVARVLLPHSRTDKVLFNACLSPSLAWDYSIAHIALSRLGYADANSDKIFRVCLESETSEGRERLPHRILEQEWLRRLWNSAGGSWRCSSSRRSSSSRRRERSIAALSKLARPIDVFASTRDDIYAFTHAIMYIADFGERTAELPRPKRDILADADATLACCLDDQDYDLCGEILLAWPYLKAKWSLTAIFALRVLARLEAMVGFLPSPLTQLDKYNSVAEEERPRYLTASIYHTAYVMGILCASLLRTKQTSFPGFPRLRNRDSIDTLIHILDGDGSKPHWRADLAELSASQRGGLVPMLITIALRRSVKSRNPEQVRRLLELSLAYGTADHQATKQAAGLLTRIARLAQRAQS